MGYSIQEIATITSGNLLHVSPSLQVVHTIQHLLTDSRKVLYPETSVFIAISGAHNDGHKYLKDVYDAGVRFFILEKIEANILPEDVSIVVVKNALDALQKLAHYHRLQFKFPVIGITGSNGKTTVKEWLHHLLKSDIQIVRSPKSYNSQVGVPLSLWQMNASHELALIEAGVSQKGEMPKLEQMIKPQIGIFTFLGSAHNEGFHSLQEKLFDKLQLFKHAELLVTSVDQDMVNEAVHTFTQHHPTLKLLTWSKQRKKADIVFEIQFDTTFTTIRTRKGAQQLQVKIPFTDEASVHNACTCFASLIAINLTSTDILKAFETLTPIEMRLQMKEGNNQSIIVSDTYNSDLNSLHIALDFLQQQNQAYSKTVILSDMVQSGLHDERLYSEIARMLSSKGVTTLIGIGERISKHKHLFAGNTFFYDTTESFISHIPLHTFNNQAILIKGARSFAFERISHLLEKRVHETTFEINLNALIHNLNVYRKLLTPHVKTMAMVKAFSYGTGSYEIAKTLEFHRVDYLTVAYADEGVALRQAGVKLPIMVMNPEISSFETIFQHQLEPEVYNFFILDKLIHACKGEEIGIHIEFDTGMKRLGFSEAELEKLLGLLKTNPNLRVKSVFTHMAASEEKKHDEFTHQQIQVFDRICSHMKQAFNYPILAHAMNSSGIVRFPNAHFDMVRLGIGLYGIDPSALLKKQLQPIGTLKSVISQISEIQPHETVGYSRKGSVNRISRIATVAIGYADGYNRKLGNGKGYMLVHGKKAPVIGSICMDMTMVDVTEINCTEGDEVIVMGGEIDIQSIADKTGTIPYEILTSISQRVKRLYYQE